ncbi:MAG: VCBS repeat-containing protein, partial [Planctomycetales bacterium]|nr:VCBS repeat-containing protein [Planctomycetales bacterium]
MSEVWGTLWDNCRHVTYGGLHLAVLLGAGCRDSPAPPVKDGPTPITPSPAIGHSATPWGFNDGRAATGIDATYRNGEEANHYSILESLGGGVAIVDFDHDGRPDVLLPGGGTLTEDQRILGRELSIFRQVDPGRFAPVQSQACANQTDLYSHGIAAADFDNDGFADFLITGYGAPRLYHNLGDGTFDEIHVAAGLNESQWSSSAAWGDLNGDGNLDLYIAHYVNWSFENHPQCHSCGPHDDVCGPGPFDGLQDILYLSDGAGGFRNATADWELKPGGKGLGVILADVDLDHDLDVYVANDTVDNFYYLNENNSGLQESSVLAGVAGDDAGRSNGSMGIAIGNLDNDDLPDLFVTNFQDENHVLYRNLGGGMFQPTGRATGLMALGSLFVGFGTTAADFDLDGDEDISIANGHVCRFATPRAGAQVNHLMESIGDGKFQKAELGDRDAFGAAHVSRGLATGDLDGDGD